MPLFWGNSPTAKRLNSLKLNCRKNSQTLLLWSLSGYRPKAANPNIFQKKQTTSEPISITFVYDSITIIFESVATIAFKLQQSLFLRDPDSTELGQKIIKSSIRLIDTLGFEDFTFKKLADEIQSTEASVYRYFENKHRLLLYLIDWYWTWLKYKIDFATNNIHDPKEKLTICLKLLTEETKQDVYSEAMDGKALQRIVMAEFEKTYLTKQVDSDNKDGVFLPFKAVCKCIAEIIKEVNPAFPFPSTLASTLILSINHQLYYAEHLPSLTDIKFNPHKHYDKLFEFMHVLTFNTLNTRYHVE
ncbi:MAG: TetR/AcrR family transcriptional regulator [Cyclobacteriaceae bacterium]|nr:TetR/AcrR family transcriptional regulator [Cyclobacteriaceae bacterium]